MFQNIPKERTFLYLILLGLLPLIFSLIYFQTKQGEVSSLAASIDDLKNMALIREKKQATNMAVISHYHDADHFYIDKYLETLTFLEPEVEGLHKTLSNKNVADDEVIKKRLEFLTGSGNMMSFSEGVVQSTPFFQETTETLVHPVEVNLQDVQKILAKVEGVTIGEYQPSPNRPQLLILDFKLERKPINERNEVFQLNLKLLKREFL